MITTVIFDMEGVISDTQILHASIESQLLAQQGIDLSPDEITKKYARGMKCIGYVANGVAKEVVEEMKQEYPADVVVDSLGKVSGEMIKELQIKPILRNL